EVTEGHNNEGKLVHEKSKHSIPGDNPTSNPTASRLVCDSVYLGTHSGGSQGSGTVQWHRIGLRRNSGARRSVHDPRTRDQLRKRESAGSLYRNRRILPELLRRPSKYHLHWHVRLVCC